MSVTFIAPVKATILRQYWAPLHITSPVLIDQGPLPKQYTCDGADINPSFDIGGIPANAKSLAIVLEDLDHPGIHRIHWLAWNIPVIRHLREARLMEAEGTNDFHVPGYTGPCPVEGTHRYRFNVYALDTLLDLPAGSRESYLDKKMSGHIIGFGNITVIYIRK